MTFAGVAALAAAPPVPGLPHARPSSPGASRVRTAKARRNRDLGKRDLGRISGEALEDAAGPKWCAARDVLSIADIAQTYLTAGPPEHLTLYCTMRYVEKEDPGPRARGLRSVLGEEVGAGEGAGVTGVTR